VFLLRIPFGLVKCTPVNHGPIVPCPFRRASPIGGTPWVSIFRAAGASRQIAAYAAMPPAAIVARNLPSSERLDLVVHGGSSQVNTWPGMGGRRGR
jgi:hypothetical protein